MKIRSGFRDRFAKLLDAHGRSLPSAIEPIVISGKAIVDVEAKTIKVKQYGVDGR